MSVLAENNLNVDLYNSNKEAFEYISSIINDVYSFNREFLDETACNCVYQCMINEKVDAQKAMNIVAKSFYDWVDKWEKTSKQLIEKYGEIENIEKYIKCLNYVSMGNLIWSVHSPRYVRLNHNIVFE